MLDAVARPRARRLQCRYRHDELGRGDAVHGHRGAVVVAITDPFGECREIEVVVVQDALARRQAVHALQEFSVPVGLCELDDVLDPEIRGGVGDPGDAVGGEPAADVRKSGFPALQRIRPMRIGTAQPPVGVIGQSDPGQTGRVERPQHAAAVLHANRDGGRQVVEHVAVERTCDGFVVPDGPDPAVFADGHAGQHPAERFTVGDLPWSDAHRGQCRCSGMQVDVVVVQAGDDGAVRGVEHQLARGGASRSPTSRMRCSVRTSTTVPSNRVAR